MAGNVLEHDYALQVDQTEMHCKTLIGPLWPGVVPLSRGLSEVITIKKTTSAEDVQAAVFEHVLPRSRELGLRLHRVAATLLRVVREVDRLWVAAVQVCEAVAGSDV